MNAADIMIKTKVIPSETTVQQASGVFKETGLRELVVSDKGKLDGMISTLWLTEVGSKPDTKVGHIMFKPPSVKPSADLNTIIRKMVDNALETLPVVDGESLLGVVTTSAILKTVKFDGTVGDVMVDPISIRSKETIMKAKRLMRLHHINRLPVINQGKLVGIISSSDIVKKMQLKEGYSKRADMMGDVIHYFDSPIESIMENDVVTVAPEDSLNDGAKKMINKDIRALPVIAGDRLVGIICRKDLIRRLYPYVSGAMVNFTGLKGVSDWDVMQLRSLTTEWVRKLNHYLPLDFVDISVKKIHAGNVFKVSVKLGKRQILKKKPKAGKVVSGEEKLISGAEGFGLIAIATEAFQKLERQLSSSKTKIS